MLQCIEISGLFILPMKIWKKKSKEGYFRKLQQFFITDLAALAVLATQTAQTAESCTTKIILNARLGI